MLALMFHLSTTLVDNAKYVMMIEGFNNPPTLWDIVVYGESLLGSGRNANISVKIFPSEKLVTSFQ